MALYAYFFQLDDGPRQLGEIEAIDAASAGELANHRHAPQAARILRIHRVWEAGPKRLEGPPPPVECVAVDFPRLRARRSMDERPLRRAVRR